MLKLTRLLDKVIGYAYIPSSTNNPDLNQLEDGMDEANDDADADQRMDNVDPRADLTAYPLPQLTGIEDIQDVQERWVDNKDAYEEWEKAQADVQTQEESG